MSKLFCRLRTALGRHQGQEELSPSLAADIHLFGNCGSTIQYCVSRIIPLLDDYSTGVTRLIAGGDGKEEVELFGRSN